MNLGAGLQGGLPGGISNSLVSSRRILLGSSRNNTCLLSSSRSSRSSRGKVREGSLSGVSRRHRRRHRRRLGLLLVLPVSLLSSSRFLTCLQISSRISHSSQVILLLLPVSG